MSIDKFIAGKVDQGHHDGLRSTRRRLDASFAQLTNWRNQNEAAHLGGHEPDQPELCFPGEIGGHFQDVIAVPTGIIFEQPEVIAMMQQNKSARNIDVPTKISDIQKELKLIADSAKYDGSGTEI